MINLFPKASSSKTQSPQKTLPEFIEMQRGLNRTLPDAHIETVDLPGTPIRLGLINADYQTGPLDPQVMQAVIAEPAYWAFCWGSGLAMARWITGDPTLVAGKTVIDLGSGSGVVAIAAAMAGARTVWACDNDADALIATQSNANANGVSIITIDDVDRLPQRADLLLMADVLYDRRNFALIEAAKQRCRELVIADSRIESVEDRSFVLGHVSNALTLPNIGEFEEYRSVRFFHWKA